ncbi:CinA-like protein [Acetoanaerobium sticklandii]|uniref:Putative competence-damage inducible protein n=1 Tax=Acetoanaerobium sticklandii (strain ATCC 12662 / DSM 519 / JCM 1433 / CCUG 9281 / NCIMB 10654 / HF) TaxID=499177 RepID=E3PST0_ACESD|nr:competence/damage-inducible protein A [Acetoanaerobium sticklandii]CBH21934.1 CinA-like protein [Acetoanaerobium sticklandii]
MKAEIIAVGTELLMGEILNSNSRDIARELYNLGIDVYHQSVVGDNLNRVSKELETAFERADLVITTGGLGPTRDDLTKEAAAHFLKRDMILDEESIKHLEDFFGSRGLPLNEGNKRQAYFPEGAKIIPNENGTAPACIIEFDEKVLVILPGPPREVIPLMEKYIIPYLEKRTGKVFISDIINISGIGEGHMEEKIMDIIEAQENPTVAPYAKEHGLTLRVTASASTEQETRLLLEPVVKKICDRLGMDVYAIGDTTLEAVVASLLIEQNLSISVAESCSGGLLAGRLINYPGISKVFKEGFITYSNESKINTLGVDSKILSNYGAVSEEVAKQMAKGAANRAKSDVALSITGIAGPDGGTDEKPVGLVYIGLYLLGEVKVMKMDSWGSRDNVRRRAVSQALDMLRRELQIRASK